jgi:hypothetical protein
MTPPKPAAWLLDRLGIAPPLVGDLLEEFQTGRSRLWFWRQTLRAVGSAVARSARVHPRQLLAVVIGWALQFCAAMAI